jgi:flagellar biosynthesis/type III secretory pathway protein FliH
MQSSQELENEFIATEQVQETLNGFEAGKRQQVELAMRFAFRTGDSKGYETGVEQGKRMAAAQCDLSSPANSEAA